MTILAAFLAGAATLLVGLVILASVLWSVLWHILTGRRHD